MAAVEDDNLSEASNPSGGWTDEEQVNEQEYEEFNQEVRDDRLLMQHRMANNDWCTCGDNRKCWPPGFAQSSLDLKCCQEIPSVAALCQELEDIPGGRIEPYRCITDHPAFYYHCIFRRHLQNSYHIYRKEGHDDRHTHHNAKLRYTAFRSFTTLVYGRLGRQVRREIPMCVTKLIRVNYPDPHGNYTGFKPVDFDDLP